MWYLKSTVIDPFTTTAAHSVKNKNQTKQEENRK